LSSSAWGTLRQASVQQAPGHLGGHLHAARQGPFVFSMPCSAGAKSSMGRMGGVCTTSPIQATMAALSRCCTMCIPWVANVQLSNAYTCLTMPFPPLPLPPPAAASQTDISTTLIQQLQAKHAHIPNLSYCVSDCRCMPEFKECSFGSVIDKGEWACD
jgi:hypothetical protein